MATITTGGHPKALWPGVNAWFGAKYEEHPERYTALFDTYSSRKNYEEDVQQTGFGLAPVKDEGAPTSFVGHSQGYISRYTHVAYALGYIVTKEELDDNLYEEVSMRRAESLAFSMRQTKENVAAQIYNRAFNSSYTGGDGLELLSTAHVTPAAGTYQNEPTTATDLSEAAVEDLVILIRKATGDDGLRVAIQPKSLIVPPDLEFDACRILDSTLQNDSANNAINALRSLSKIPEGVKVNEYLTDTDAWFIRTNCPHGMKHFNRTSMEFSKDNEFNTENAMAKAYERYSFGWSNPRGLYGSPGA